MIKETFSKAHNVGNFIQDTILKATGDYNEDRKQQHMIRAFKHAYIHSPSKDEETIRKTLQDTIDNDHGSLTGYFFNGTFSIDDVLKLVEDLPEDEKAALEELRTAYKDEMTTEWEKIYYSTEEASPA